MKYQFGLVVSATPFEERAWIPAVEYAAGRAPCPAYKDDHAPRKYLARRKRTLAERRFVDSAIDSVACESLVTRERITTRLPIARAITPAILRGTPDDWLVWHALSIVDSIGEELIAVDLGGDCHNAGVDAACALAVERGLRVRRLLLSEASPC